MVDADESQPIKELSPGNILLQARLQAGLTQEQVAKELYMTISKVKALEADDYSRLSSDTFARGYIRAYANLVKVDVVVALTAYDKLIEDLKPTITTQNSVAATTESGQRGTWQFLIVIAAFLVGLWLISVWFFDNHSESDYPVTAVPTASVSSAATEQVRESTAVFSTGASEAASSSSLGSGLEIAVVSSSATSINSSAASFNASKSISNISSAVVEATSSVAAQSSASVSVKKSSLDEITFSFRAECWLEVSDSRGDVLATELEPAGGKIKLLGRAPFDVKLGNAPAATIELNGKKVDVVPLIGTNVLILKVGN